MADVGFEFTHFGEFAWTFIEPEEGKFDFSWLDDVVELATKTELKSSCALHRQHHLH